VEHGHTEMLDIFYEIMCQSWRTLGTPIYRKSYFRSILEVFGEKIRIFVVYRGDTPVATAFSGYDKGTAEGMWAGGVPKYRNLNSNYVLYWEMIKLACEAGLDRFHLGRSSADSGGETFKKKWGATAQQLYWQYYLPDGGEIPQLNVNNPKYQLAIAVWRKMPLWATRVLGPTLARSIP
jgi:lipid II:glycine glycyltransferase (peptidoglycan interpeptide bridge formation enzyme)